MRSLSSAFLVRLWSQSLTALLYNTSSRAITSVGISCRVINQTPADTPYRVMEESCRLRNAVAAAFVDFKKSLIVCIMTSCWKKLNCEFGVKGSLLDLICNYLSGRQQFTALNGIKWVFLPVSMGIPQGLVLGPTLTFSCAFWICLYVCRWYNHILCRRNSRSSDRSTE